MAEDDFKCQICGGRVSEWISLDSPHSWYWRNVAPDAANGGSMKPCHHRCKPFDLTVRAPEQTMTEE
jgi:hypothetical protein